MGQIEYFSSFGGLWTDRLDADEELMRRQSAGRIPIREVDLLADWIRDGYIVIPNAVPANLLDRLAEDLERVWDEGHPHLLADLGGHGGNIKPMTPDVTNVRHKILDIHAYFRSALDAIFAPAITRFLRLVFERHPLCFQTLAFRKGSEQGMHRDTAYVVVDQPLKLAASWIALEDIKPGSGNLEYIVGGHRIPEYRFSGRYKHWNSSRDGTSDHDIQAMEMMRHAERMKLRRETFSPKRGDALIWAADLPHGGAQILDATLTRKSLVAHYCPHGCTPHYFSNSPENRTIREDPSQCYSTSWYYKLNELPEPS